MPRLRHHLNKALSATCLVLCPESLALAAVLELGAPETQKFGAKVRAMQPTMEFQERTSPSDRHGSLSGGYSLYSGGVYVCMSYTG
ncbi:hypothetical protein V8C37DRAFT_384510 [Trichoderma ceciliae]